MKLIRTKEAAKILDVHYDSVGRIMRREGIEPERIKSNVLGWPVDEVRRIAERENVFTVLNLGGGVQSSTIAEQIAEGDWPTPDAAIFADTGDELQDTYYQIEYLFGRLRGVGVECHIVSIGNIIEDATNGGRFVAMPLYTNRNGKRGIMRRQCTREYKITPIERKTRELLLEKDWALVASDGSIRVKNGTIIERWLGISTDEVQRMNRDPRQYTRNRWPLIEQRMSREDCVKYLLKRGLPLPTRSACRVCPYHSKSYWRWLRDERPEDWEHVVEFDKFLRSDDPNNRIGATADGELYLHSDCVPLDQLVLTDQINEQLRIFDDEETMCDTGHCFI